MLRLFSDQVDTRHTHKQQPVSLCKSHWCMPFIEIRACVLGKKEKYHLLKATQTASRVCRKTYRLLGSFYSWL